MTEVFTAMQLQIGLAYRRGGQGPRSCRKSPDFFPSTPTHAWIRSELPVVLSAVQPTCTDTPRASTAVQKLSTGAVDRRLSTWSDGNHTDVRQVPGGGANTTRDPHHRHRQGDPMAADQPIQHRALCHRCGRLATSEVTFIRKRVAESVYTCDRGHLWSARWVEAVSP